MRIVYVSPVGVLGGAEQCLLNVMASVRQADPSAEVHLIASADGPLLRQAETLGVPVHLVEMPPTMAELGDSILLRRKGLRAVFALAGRAASVLPRTSGYVLRLRRTLRQLRPDVIHSNGLKAHLLTALAKPRQSRLIWHLHDFIAARPAMARALRLAARRADGAIAISDAVATDAATVLPTLPITTVFNAIDIVRFSPGSGDGRRLDRLAGMPAAPDRTVRVGLVATYARWKGQEVLLQAAALLIGSRSSSLGPVIRGDGRGEGETLINAEVLVRTLVGRQESPPHRGSLPIRFFIIGGPIYRTRGSQYSLEELQAKARELGIADRVGFVPFQPDTAAVYRDLDIVVHASTNPEPFGLTIVEAMACGRPVIVSRAGGAAEIFTEGVDALGVPPADPDALASAISRLAKDAELRTRLSDEAVATGRARFSHERLGGEMLSVYATACKS